MKLIWKFWLKAVSTWNKTVVLLLLFLIWWMVFAPTAILWRLLHKKQGFKLKPQPQSFLKKSLALPSNHFKNPF